MSGSTLKIIAMVSMVFDHIAVVLLDPVSPIYWTFRFIGRIAFPIFLFLLVEGYLHTSDKKKYARNLCFFAFLSEIPFDLAIEGHCFYFDYQNVMFTLLFAYFAIGAFDTYQKTKGKKYLFGVVFFALLAQLCKTDYGAFGVISAVILFATRSQKQFYLSGVLLFLYEITAPLAFCFFPFYNGKRGLSLKYVFYFFYPLHLLLLAFIRFAIF